MLGFGPVSGQPVSALPTALQAFALTAAPGSFALTGQAADLKYGRVVSAGQGSFTLTGQSANLKATRLTR
jgi:hypothetical protein